MENSQKNSVKLIHFIWRVLWPGLFFKFSDLLCVWNTYLAELALLISSSLVIFSSGFITLAGVGARWMFAKALANAFLYPTDLRFIFNFSTCSSILSSVFVTSSGSVSVSEEQTAAALDKGPNHLLHWRQISVKTWTEVLLLVNALMEHFLEVVLRLGFGKLTQKRRFVFYLLYFSFGLYQSLNGAIPSRQCSKMEPAK